MNSENTLEVAKLRHVQLMINLNVNLSFIEIAKILDITTRSLRKYVGIIESMGWELDHIKTKGKTISEIQAEIDAKLQREMDKKLPKLPSNEDRLRYYDSTPRDQ